MLSWLWDAQLIKGFLRCWSIGGTGCYSLQRDWAETPNRHSSQLFVFSKNVLAWSWLAYLSTLLRSPLSHQPLSTCCNTVLGKWQAGWLGRFGGAMNVYPEIVTFKSKKWHHRNSICRSSREMLAIKKTHLAVGFCSFFNLHQLTFCVLIGVQVFFFVFQCYLFWRTLFCFCSYTRLLQSKEINFTPAPRWHTFLL